MKAKASNRPFVTTSIRATRLKDSDAVLTGTGPLLRPRPFLAQTLRLRLRASPRG